MSLLDKRNSIKLFHLSGSIIMIVIRNRDVIDSISLDLVIVWFPCQSSHLDIFRLRFLTILGIQPLNFNIIGKNYVEDMIRYLNCTSSQEI